MDPRSGHKTSFLLWLQTAAMNHNFSYQIRGTMAIKLENPITGHADFDL